MCPAGDAAQGHNRACALVAHHTDTLLGPAVGSVPAAAYEQQGEAQRATDAQAHASTGAPCAVIMMCADIADRCAG